MNLDAAIRVSQAYSENWRVIVVNDAWQLLPQADLLYAADLHWWRTYGGVTAFHGERWCCRDPDGPPSDERIAAAERFNLRLVGLRVTGGFSTDPRWIHSGDEAHSGFQAVNIALLLGCTRVVLIGFDFKRVNGYSHFFGDHPPCLRPKMHDEAAYYASFARAYRRDARIVNASPDSALKCYETLPLDQALRTDDRLHRHGAVTHH